MTFKLNTAITKICLKIDPRSRTAEKQPTDSEKSKITKDHPRGVKSKTHHSQIFKDNKFFKNSPGEVDDKRKMFLVAFGSTVDSNLKN
jgi:hypothetical protein